MLCGISAGVTLLFFLTLFMPASRRLIKVKAEVYENIMEQKNAGDKLTLLSDLKRCMVSAQEKLNTHKSRIPDSSKNLEVINSIEKLPQKIAALEAVSIKMLDSSEIKESGLKKQLVEVVLEGNYSSVADFMRGVTHMENIVTIEKLDIELNDQSTLKATTIIAYYLTGDIKTIEEDDEYEE